MDVSWLQIQPGFPAIVHHGLDVASHWLCWAQQPSPCPLLDRVLERAVV
jgi:hypothetical protein